MIGNDQKLLEIIKNDLKLLEMSGNYEKNDWKLLEVCSH
jgi:hypothetical protein